jgi:uncharacterized membrane protein
MKRNNKAQMTMIGLLMFFCLVIIVANLMPTITYNIAIGKNASGLSVGTQALMDMIPLFIILALIITLFIYVTPYRQQ